MEQKEQTVQYQPKTTQQLEQENSPQIKKQNKTKTSKKIYIQQRDVNILKFLDRVGYANVVQITKATMGTTTISTSINDDSKSQAAVLRRLYLLRRFEYIKIFSTHHGNYYALTNKSKGENQLISSIKLDQLLHHDFLIELFLLINKKLDSTQYVLSEREVITTYKIVGKKGKIPDMIINDWIIEYERTNKSAADCKSVVDYWTSEQGKHLCVIYETEEIKNRYTTLLNPRVKLLARKNYTDILLLLTNQQDALINYNNNEQVNDNSYRAEIKNKYL